MSRSKPPKSGPSFHTPQYNEYGMPIPPGVLPARRRNPFMSCLIVGVVILGVAGVIGYIALKNLGVVLHYTVPYPAATSSDPNVQATTAADMTQITTALGPRMASWQAQTDTVVHHVPYADAGFKSTDNTKEVVYGHCLISGFYIFVLENSIPENPGADTEGYGYLPSFASTNCLPSGWHMVTTDNTAPNWFFVTLNTSDATATAAVVSTPGGTIIPK